MKSRARFLMVSLATLAAVVGVGIMAAVSASGAREGDASERRFTYAKITFSEYKAGPVQGIIAAAQRTPTSKIEVAVSLTGVEPRSKYQVVATTTPCSQQPTKDSIVYSLPVRTTAGSNVFKSAVVPARLSLSEASSVYYNPKEIGVDKLCEEAISDQTGRVGIAAAPERANYFVFHNITWTIVDAGPVQGIVATSQQTPTSKVGVSVALTGVEPRSKYQILATTGPCSERPTRASTVYGLRLGTKAKTGFFKSGLVPARRPLDESVSTFFGLPEVGDEVLVRPRAIAGCEAVATDRP